MTHTCHATQCNMKVAPKLLFCLRHWRILPPVWQKQIWKEYRRGQEVTKDPSPEYLFVQAVAVAIVAYREGIWTSEQATEHIGYCSYRLWPALKRDWVDQLPGMGNAGTGIFVQHPPCDMGKPKCQT